MSTVNDPMMGVDERHEPRDPTNVFVKIKVLDGREGCNLIVRAVDVSRSGICLLTYKACPIGTRIAVTRADGKFIGIGEVVNLDKEWDCWEWSGMEHMGLHFIDRADQ